MVTQKVVVDRSLCTGLGHCEVAAPGVFEIDDDGDLHVRVETVAPDQLDAVRKAVEGCPTKALALLESPTHDH